MFASLVLTEEQQARRLAQKARKMAWERKRRLEAEREQIEIIPSKDLTERQIDWIKKNCQPKIRRLKIMKHTFSRWAKRGPMTNADWKKFFKWADINAEPKQQPKPHCPVKDTRPKQKIDLSLTPEELWEHIDKLAVPKMPRTKYEYPLPIEYPYSPRIHYRKPAKHDKGRPFNPPAVPLYFHHIELEMDFWSKLRFPIRRAALNFTAPPSVLEMAKPRVTPPFEPHCPIPEKPVEYVAPRQRMTKSQWEKHKNRLAFLAAPISRGSQTSAIL